MIYLGLLIFFVLEYVRPSNYFPELLRVNSLLPLTVSVAAILKSGKVSNTAVLQEPSTQRLLVFLGLLVISALTSDVTERAINLLWAVVGYVLIYVVIVKQATSVSALKGIFAALVLVHVAIAALNPQIFGSLDREYITAGPFLGDGNDFALSLNIAVPLSLFLMLDTRRMPVRLLWMGITLFLVFCIIVTQSRGGTIALLCVGLYYWSLSKQKLRIGGAAAVALVMVLVAAPPTYFERMQDLTNTEEGSAQGRIQAWRAGTRMAIDNPILGVGAGLFGVMYGAAYGSAIGPQTAHSIYFLILGELGFPGIIWLLAHLWSEYAANHRLRRAIVARHGTSEGRRELLLLISTSAALIAFATGGAFLSAVYYPHLYVIAGLLVASRRLALAEQEGSPVSAASSPREVSVHWALRPAASGAPGALKGRLRS